MHAGRPSGDMGVCRAGELPQLREDRGVEACGGGDGVVGGDLGAGTALPRRKMVRVLLRGARGGWEPITPHDGAAV